MGVIADVIIPVFCTPYCLPFALPLAGLAVLATEVAVFKLLNRHLGLGTIIAVVIPANVVSTIVGFLIAAALPSGYVTRVIEPGNYHTQTFVPVPLFDTYLYLSFFVAFVLSVIVEYPIVRGCLGLAKIKKPFVTVLLANVVSYIALVVIALISVHVY
jgi:hypothetical protein